MKAVQILTLLFDGYTALDVIGPYEVLARVPQVKFYFVGDEKRDYKDSYGLKLSADYSLDEVARGDVLFIPGGFGIDSILKDERILEWVRKVDSTSTWTVAVCSGSLLLAQAGLLDGRKCTTHWRRKKQLAAYGVAVKDERYVEDGKFITSAGVSAGVDMALYLASKLASDRIAQMIQLGLEYAPRPPFDCGTPDKAPLEVLEMMKG
ncbi:MAG TPA: DJ-1/PfpI family protein [Syntrophorhabdaceae bacterium]|nr:DJ-1/PfpI family protein [Syntrophorhabdaceae bacterium]